MSLRGTGKRSCADGAGEDQLWPQVLPGGPLARWHKPQLASSHILDRLANKVLRGLVESAETCKKVRSRTFLTLRQRSKRAYHRRAFVQLKNQLCLRAHTQIQTHMPPEPYDRKAFGLPPYCPALLDSEQGTEKYSPQPISARFDRCREAKKDPIGIFFACFS